MDDEIRCQSCGMPLMPGNFGTDAAGQEQKTYCKFCYQKGSFTEPDLTAAGMVEKSVRFMTAEFKMPEARAREMSEAVIPKLKRWNP